MSRMRTEALASAACCEAFARDGLPAAMQAGAALRALGVRTVEVLGRGSSSHAGTVLRYALAAGGDVSVAAAMPSIAAAEAPLAHLRDAAVIALSQSGRSPDLVRYAAKAAAAGAHVISFTNVPGSPLGAAARCDIALGAGPELAVAATKSVLASMLAGLALVAGWRADTALADALRGLPPRLRTAATADWSPLERALVDARAVYVLGRGTELGVAKEIALKIAETAGVPALAYSSAEFLHGPLAALGPRTPVLALALRPEGQASAREALTRAQALGAPTLLAAAPGSLDGVAPLLPLPALADSLADVLLPLVPAWLAIEAAASAAGRDPDQPRGLAKVTETL